MDNRGGHPAMGLPGPLSCPLKCKASSGVHALTLLIYGLLSTQGNIARGGPQRYHGLQLAAPDIKKPCRPLMDMASCNLERAHHQPTADRSDIQSLSFGPSRPLYQAHEHRCHLSIIDYGKLQRSLVQEACLNKLLRGPECQSAIIRPGYFLI